VQRIVTRCAWLVLSVAVLAVATWARARDYESVVAVRDLEDLEELHLSGGLDDEVFELLAELLLEGVSLNLASREELYLLPGISREDADRILHYRDVSGTIDHPSELVRAGILTSAQVRMIKPFLMVEPREPARPKGQARLRTAWSPVDGLGPTSALQFRLRASHRVRLGMAAVGARRRLRAIGWDPQPWFVLDEYGRQGVLTAAPSGHRVLLPKYFAQFEGRTWGSVVGTYAVGFGEGLTFDSTGRRLPNGFLGDDAVVGQLALTSSCRESGGELANGLGASPCTGAQRHARSLTDFRWRERQRGFAFRLGPPPGESVERGLRLFGWVSAQPRSVYQHDVYHTGLCPDPRVGDAHLCGPPFVYRNPAVVGVGTTRFRQQQLPGLFAERLVGAHVSVLFGPRARIGMTGYAADLRPRLPGAAFDFRPSARYPSGGAFGALGVDAAWGYQWLDLSFEAAQSFAEATRVVGTGVLARTVATWHGGEVQWSHRYYARDFQNPYAGAPAAADEYEGLRARDELGSRLEYLGRVGGGRLVTRALVDVWLQPSTNFVKAFLSWRADQQVTPMFRPGFRLELKSDDVSGTSGVGCADPDPPAESLSCRGEQVRATSRVSVTPTAQSRVSVEYRRAWRRADVGERGWASDRSVRLQLVGDPRPTLRVRIRLSWRDEDVAAHGRGEAVLAASSELASELRSQTRIALRYDIAQYVDARPSTRLRSPNPEQWARVDLVQRF
jgi:hypothetical protein